MTDARAIAAAPGGGVFVADYRTGRVQRFDAGGKVLSLFAPPPSKLAHELSVFGLAADAAHLYLCRAGDILVYRLADGKLVKTITGDYPETWYHGDLAVDAAGNLYAITDRTGRHDLLKLSPAGKLLWRQKNTGARAVAVDAHGRVALTRPDDNQIDVLLPDGALAARFGTKVEHPGAIAIDGAGRLFVENRGGIDVFDAGGGFLAQLLVPPLRDFALDAEGALLVLKNDGGVVRLAVTLP
jgi:sugar lactone lactonase YvrE